MPDGTAVLDRLIDTPEEMKTFRDSIQREQSPAFHEWRIEGKYPGSARKEDKLPGTLKEMYERMDKKVDEVLAGAGTREKEAKIKEDVPQTALRNLDEKGWLALGWPEASRREVITLLIRTLGIEESQAKQAMHLMVAEGKKPDATLMNTLRDRSNYTKYMNTEDGQAAVQGRLRQEFNQRWESNESNVSKFLYLQEDLGIKDEGYILRYVLDNDYRKVLNDQWRNEYVGQRDAQGGLYDLAWNIGYSEKEEFGVDGKYPILQMQINTKENGEVEGGRYVVNEANFIRWARNKMFKRWEEMDTDEVTNYFGELKVDKGNFTSVSLAHMLLESDFYFRDETGHKWNDLYNQFLLEPWSLMTIRQYYESYRKAMSSEDELMKVYNSEYYLSKLTRKIYGKSMLNILMTLPEDYKRRDADTKLGEAWTKMYLAYYNLADFPELEKVLGKDSSFFKKESWMSAIEEEYGSELSSPIVGAGVPRLGRFLGDKEELFAKAFAKGDITSESSKEVKDAFIKFINFYPTPTGESTVVAVVDRTLKNSVREMLQSKEANLDSHEVKESPSDVRGGKFIDDISLNFGWLIARSMTLPTGVAAKNNFPGASGHLAETKWLHTRIYRDKYMGYGGAGNPYTLHMFKKLSLPLLESILLEGEYEDYISSYEGGKPIWKKRQLTPMEVIRKMNAVSGKYEGRRNELRNQLKNATSDSERVRIELELEKIEDQATTEYKARAGQLVFKEEVMRNWAQNIIGRAKTVYENVMGGSEVNFGDFTKYDNMIRGVSFQRDKWQKAIQSGLITPLRYLVDSNGASQFNMKVRDTVYLGKDKDGKSKWGIQDMYLGEAIFGHQILDIPQFRMTAKDVPPGRVAELKKEGVTKKGKYFVRPDGKYLIDYDKVQENKTLAYKQWILMKIAADMWAHIDRHSTDPAYDMEHFLSIIEAVELLPGGADGDEFNVQKAGVTKRFFSHEQMKWLKQISGTTYTQLFRRQVFGDIFIGDSKSKETMFGKSFSIFLGRIFQGY